VAKTLYEVIGVSRTATREEIEAACLRFGEEVRPDKNATLEASARFSELEKAYETLADPAIRAEYDKAISLIEHIEGKRAVNGKLFGWGMALLVVGGLSLLLPLFHRQFVIVIPFTHLLGMHPAAVGVLFAVAGGTLIAIARSE